MSHLGSTFGSTELAPTVSERFRIERQLGEGSNGVVYLAYDQERHQWVALKALSKSTGQAIYRFKKEFRALADLRHPNLVELHELVATGDRFFFTMEHLEGEDLLDHLHRSESVLLEAEELDPRDASEVVPRLPSPVRDMDALRDVFLQIAQALCALHDQNTLHRDLKPANVMVTSSGRVVVLDFGIAAQLGDDGLRDTRVGVVVGTPAYMAPEQAYESAREPTCDWYAFGAMLYEALTGELPFDESDPVDLLERKTNADPVPPGELVGGIAADLEQLCMGLLSRAPEHRPTGQEVLDVMSRGGAAVTELAAPRRAAAPALPFVGRGAELARLEPAVADSEEGTPVLALVHGPSGIGKSTLAQQLLRAQRKRAHCVVLSGRCFEHESVAFKAFDSVVDALSRYLGHLSEVAVAGLMPRRLEVLIHVFPVLARVPAVVEARSRSRFELPADPTEVRRLAFEALRELLCRLCEDCTVIVYIDDLQWGDVDSVELIEALIGGADPAPITLLCTYRTEDLERSPCLRALTDVRVRTPGLPACEIALGGLSSSEARTLTELLSGGATRLDTNALVNDAQGSPYLLTELIQFAADSKTPGAVGLTVSSALARRIESLSADARALLSLLSIAGRPLARGIYALLRQDDVDLPSAVAELRVAKLARTGGTGGVLGVYHDRVRETVVAAMPQPERVRWHGRLLRVLEARQGTDMETLAYHSFEACEHGCGARYAVVGAQRAVREFAFDRAARLYQLAIERATLDGDERRMLLVSLAEAQILAGRRADAAASLQWAAREAPDQEAAELGRRAGQALVLAGFTDRGLELMRDALASYGQSIDGGDDMPGWFERRKRLAERGFGWVEREPMEVSPAERRRLDTLWAVGFGLFRVEGVRVHHIAAQYLLDALEMGDRYDVVRGLCFHTACVERPTRQVLGKEPLPGLERAQELAAGCEDPRMEAWILLARGFDRWLDGDPEAGPLLLSAHELFLGHCAGSAPERGLASALLVSEYTWRGLWNELQKIERWQADASSRRDVALRYTNGLAETFGAMLAGHPEDASTRIEQLRQEVAHVRFDVRFPVEMVDVICALSTGDHARMEIYDERCEQFLHTAEGLLSRWRHEALLLRCAARVQLARRDGDADMMALAQADFDAACTQPYAPHTPILMASRAMLADARGDRQGAIADLREAIEDAEHEARTLRGTSHWPDIYRYALGTLMGGQDGDAIRRRALRSLQARGVADPSHIARGMPPCVGAPEAQESGAVVPIKR